MSASTDWKAEPDDQSERLYSLTLALVSTQVGLTKDEIFSSIRGYRLDLEKAGKVDGDLSALNKKFDRDKDKLRELGVQIVPGPNSNEGDSDYRYQISVDTFKWPENTSISAKQLQLLELAASVWDRAALSPEASNAVTRLRALTNLGDTPHTTSVSPRINTIEPSFSPIKRALEDGVRISFTYRKPDGTDSVRQVEPWQLLHMNGLWMLLGFDLDRKQPRNFLLKRIHSKVIRTKEQIVPPSKGDISSAKSDLSNLFSSNIAKLKVKHGTTAAMHFETHNTPDGVAEVHFYDLAILAEEILEFGSAVHVLEPQGLIHQIRLTLEEVVKQHA